MAETLDFKKLNKKDIVKRIKQGEIFVFPTDTSYGLGCNALKPNSIESLRKISNVPFSIIAPNKTWINKNLKVHNKNYIKKLPGPFVFIMKKKGRPVSKNLNFSNDKLAIRIPDHSFSDIVKKANVPFVMLNIFNSGRVVRDINNLPWIVKRKVDIILDDGFLGGHPSSIIDITEEIAKIIRP